MLKSSIDPSINIRNITIYGESAEILCFLMLPQVEEEDVEYGFIYIDINDNNELTYTLRISDIKVATEKLCKIEG